MSSNCRHVVRREPAAVPARCSVHAAALVLALACPGAAQAASGGDFPYIAYVAAPKATMRSGPGTEHYPTSELPAGFAVEVFRHDGEGWCAVRPPEGSFSLVESRGLRIIDGRTAEVTASGAIARIGSTLGEDRSAVQVVLDEGETVHLAEPPKPGQSWIKISPPAGEFRWVEARRLSRTPPVKGSPSAAGTTSWQADLRRNGSQRRSEAAEPDNSPPSAADFAHLEPPSEEIVVVEGSPAEVQLAQYQDESPAAGGSDSGGARKSGQPRIRFPGRPVRRASGPLDPRVEELQLRLSAAIVEQPAMWRLDGLREEAAGLLAQEQSPAVRDQLRDVLDRVAAFENIKQRRIGVPAAPPLANHAPPASEAATAGAGGPMGQAASDTGDVTPTPGGLADQTPTEALYDAVGTLKPVVSRRSQAPRYALVDDRGEIVSFVTSSAELNLQPYVGKRIGIRGTRGFMPEYRRAHVTASRVTPLGEEGVVRR